MNWCRWVGAPSRSHTCAVCTARRCRKSGSTSCRPRSTSTLRSTYERMLEKGPERFQVKPSGLPVMDHLYDELPNFSEVLDDVQAPARAVPGQPRRAGDHADAAAGPAGHRQDALRARGLAAAGHRHGLHLDEFSLTAGWVLSGASSQWKGARPGKVFETLVDGAYANPVMVVDEIDKARGEHAYDPLGALYSLLEHDTARRLHRRVRRGRHRRQPGDLGGHRQRRALHSRAHPEPHERLRGARARPRRGAHHRGGCTRRSAAQHDWGERFDVRAGDAVLDRMSERGPARDAPRLDDGLRQRPARRLYGAATASRKILFVQALPAAIGLALLLLG
jgi:ATP-dependent Lon protease